MGGCPTGTLPGNFQRGARKRGLQTDLQNEIVREIETRLGCQSIADLDFEAVEIASPDLSDFAARVQREASRRDFTETQRPVVLGDGSAWIWNSATELFPQATQIFDRFHAKEHLSQVGKIIYGDSPEASHGSRRAMMNSMRAA
jgi:hypothetical protein